MNLLAVMGLLGVAIVGGVVIGYAFRGMISREITAAGKLKSLIPNLETAVSSDDVALRQIVVDEIDKLKSEL